MTDDEERERLAAEFVIGTLEPEEREAVAQRRAQDPALDRAIAAWEERLSPWLDEYAPEAAPEGLKERVLAAISDEKSEAPASMPTPPSAETKQADGEIIQLRREVTGWRAAAGVGFALAAGLAALVILQEPSGPAADRFVAVFQSDDAQPEFIMSIDLATREILIRPVSARPASGKTYQLWIASEELGGAPKSLGLLEDGSRAVRKSLPYDAALLQKATFGISLEPQGGSPTGRPTGRAIHGRLIPTDL